MLELDMNEMFIINVLVYGVVFFFSLKIWIFLRKHRKNSEYLRRIPAPPEKFFIGHLHLLTVDIDFIFQRLRKLCAEYRPIFRFSTPYVNIVHFLEPNDIELVLSGFKHLSKSKIYTFLHNWLGTGLLTSSGAKWQKRRKILTPAFHFSILQQFLIVFNEETAKLVQNLEQECGSGKIVNVVKPVTHFTLQSISETAMGLATIDQATKEKYKNAIHKIGYILLERLSKPWYIIESLYNLSQLASKERATVKVLHDFSTAIIKEREKSISTGASIDGYSKKKRLAMLDLLLQAKRDGADIDFEGIREEVDTFMFEGHDTTAMALSFTLLTLANLPEIQEKILEEIVTVLGPDRSPSYNDFQELKYTERCIKEVLRLFPSVPFISRYASEDYTTKTGYFIPEGTVIHIHIYDLHRDPVIYPNPLKFDPDRFLPQNANVRHPFAYIPFSAGPRNCIGQRFAFLELKALICGVLRRFRLEKVDDMYEVQFRPDLVLRPKEEVRVKLIPRV